MISLNAPRRAASSPPFTLAAATLTRTSPLFGAGTGNVSICSTSGGPYRWNVTARMVVGVLSTFISVMFCTVEWK